MKLARATKGKFNIEPALFWARKKVLIRVARQTRWDGSIEGQGPRGVPGEQKAAPEAALCTRSKEGTCNLLEPSGP